MNCHEARDAMLVADLKDLRAGSPALGDHLETCPRCRGLAKGIAGDTALLGAQLERRTHPVRRRINARRVAVLASLPIAAAIVGAVALNVSRRPEPVVPSPSAKPVIREVSLTVAPGQSAAVIKTPDPTVTVIWLNQGGGQ
jgi:hypothetical protein